MALKDDLKKKYGLTDDEINNLIAIISGLESRATDYARKKFSEEQTKKGLETFLRNALNTTGLSIDEDDIADLIKGAMNTYNETIEMTGGRTAYPPPPYGEEEIEHKRRPWTRTLYEPYVRSATRGKSRVTQLAGVWSKRKGREEAPRVNFNIAVNSGKKELMAYGNTIYVRQVEPMLEIVRREYETLRRMIANLRDAKRTLKTEARRLRGGWKGFGAGLAFNPEKLLSNIESIIANLQRGGQTPSHALLDARQAFQQYIEQEERATRIQKETIENASRLMRRALHEKANAITVKLSRRFNFPVNSRDERDLGIALREYAEEVAEDYIARARTSAARFRRVLESFSRSLRITGNFWDLVKYGVWSFLTGPIILGLILAFAEFWMIFAYVGATQPIPFPLMLGLGAGTGILLVLIQFTETEYPLDFIANFISGVLIGFSAILLVICFGTIVGEPTVSWLWFVVGFIILVFLGIFQVYQHGEFRALLPIVFVIILFSYAIIGPYGGYTRYYVDQVKEPLRIAWLSIQDGFYNVWLLTTNPTEWYAQQQRKNVRPERPIAYPQGVEITMLSADPSSVPQDEQFFVTGVIENKGDMIARDVRITIENLKNCDGPKKMPTDKGSWTLKKGAGKTIRFDERFTADGSPREYAEVMLAVSYNYSTSSSLLTQVMTEQELASRQLAGESVFRPVVAVGKVGPAQLSLNVGPQPLESGGDAMLLVSVLNTRRELASVILPAGTIINITVPERIGRILKCSPDGLIDYELSAGGHNAGVRILKDQEVKPLKANTIFSFFCDIEITDITEYNTGSLTDVITATMPSYTYKVMKKVSVLITEPLGIRLRCDELDGRCIEYRGGDKNNTCIDKLGAGWIYKSEGYCTRSGYICCVKKRVRVPSPVTPVIPETFVHGYNLYKGEIMHAVDKHGLARQLGDKEKAKAFIAAMITVESKWVVNAISCAGAGGLMQLMPGTARDLGLNVPAYAKVDITDCDGRDWDDVPICNKKTPDECSDYDERFSADKNIDAGTMHIKDRLDHYRMYEDMLEFAIAAYNWGQSRVDNAIEDYSKNNNITKWNVFWDDISQDPGISVPKETQDYVSKVLDEYQSWQNYFNEFLFAWPTESMRITGVHGEPRIEHKHAGIDIGAKRVGVSGDDVYAAADGVVEKTETGNPTAGNFIVLKHEINGETYYTRYLHLYTIEVYDNQDVEKDDVIGTMGDSGSPGQVHLHFEIRTDYGSDFAGSLNPCEGKRLDCYPAQIV